MTEVGMGGTSREDQIVVGDGGLVRITAGALIDHDHPRVRIDAIDLREQHTDVLLMAKDPSRRRRDVARRQRCRCDLIQHRLKEVVVVAVEQRHLDRRTSERARRVESAETAADNHHVWRRAHVLDNT